MKAVSSFCRLHPIVLLVIGSTTMTLLSDQIEMTNGDRYTGKLVSVSETEVRFQSEVQGLINLRREKVSLISFGDKATVSRTSSPALPETAAVQSGSLTNIVDQLKVHGIDPSLIEKVRKDYLGDSGPEASDLFNRMLSGLMSNKISVTDIQSQAKSVLSELDDLKKDFDDPDISGLLNQYGSILETFLRQVDAEGKSLRTNSVPKVPKAAPSPK
jgi:hypothetical protein